MFQYFFELDVKHLRKDKLLNDLLQFLSYFLVNIDYGHHFFQAEK